MDTYEARHNLLWSVQRSARYHARRQAFFDRWRRITAGIGVIFGSAAAADLLNGGGHLVAVIASFLVAAASALDLVVGTADMAWQHRELRSRFLTLLCSIQRSNDEPSEEDIYRWQEERLSIEKDEPPIYVGVDLLCENEMARAHDMDDRATLTPWEVFTAHWLRWEDLPSKMKARTNAKTPA